MNKYIYCFIFGLILFLILNSKNGFSIGGLNKGDLCDLVDDLCMEDRDGADEILECELNDDPLPVAVCCGLDDLDEFKDCEPDEYWSADEGVEEVDAPKIIVDTPAIVSSNELYINMFGTSNDKEECVKQDKCKEPNKLEKKDIAIFGQTDFLIDNCPRLDRECTNYHTMPYECHNKCPVEISNFSSLDEDSSIKTMEESGFEFIREVFTKDKLYTQYLVLMNNEMAKNTRKNDIYSYIKKYDLFFQEYILIKYLEKIYTDKHVHKIDFGLFYIDGFLYFYKLTGALFRSDIPKHLFKELERDAKLTDTKILFRGTLAYGVSDTFPSLHFDYANYPLQYNDLYRGTNDEVRSILSSSDKYTRLLRKRKRAIIDIFFDLDSIDVFNDYITKNKIHISEENFTNFRKYMNGFKKNFEYFNIWIKLDGTENSKSLAFADINESDLPGMLVDDGNLNISRINKNRPAPHVNYMGPLYTPESMNPGDILRFDTKHTPHVALKQDPNEWRLSGETRYCTLKKDFNIENFYTVDDSNKLVQKDDVTLTSGDFIPIIDKSLFNYFSAKYIESDATTIEEFKIFINNNSIFHLNPSVTECIDGETWSPNGVDVPAPCKACRICEDDQYVIHTCIKTRNKQCGGR